MNDRLYVGSYARPGNAAAEPGGISVFERSGSGSWSARSIAGAGLEAGYLALGPDARALYAVDERKTDGRGPVGPQAAIHAFAINPHDGSLTSLGDQPAFGAFPTYLSTDPHGAFIATASHGSFDHIERVVAVDDGWTTEYEYDDSTVCLYPIADTGALTAASDVHVFRGHGIDPGPSPQAGGHAQSGSHIHSAQFDPTGMFVVACDKGTDRIHVLRVDRAAARLIPASTWRAPAGSAPRHPAFDSSGTRMYVTNELASTVSSFVLDPQSGSLRELSTVPSTSPSFDGYNEPADIQVHPSGRYVVVNNRGEDSVVSFAVDDAGVLVFADRADLARSPHPGLAARCLRFDRHGSLLVADRPADVVRSYRFDLASGSMTPASELPVSQPAFSLPVASDRR